MRQFLLWTNHERGEAFSKYSSETLGAYHLAEKSGNFGSRSDGKAIFRKIFSEILGNLQR